MRRCGIHPNLRYIRNLLWLHPILPFGSQPVTTQGGRFGS